MKSSKRKRPLRIENLIKSRIRRDLAKLQKDIEASFQDIIFPYNMGIGEQVKDGRSRREKSREAKKKKKGRYKFG